MGRRGAFSSGAFTSHLKAKSPSSAVTETLVAEAAGSQETVQPTNVPRSLEPPKNEAAPRPLRVERRATTPEPPRNEAAPRPLRVERRATMPLQNVYGTSEDDSLWNRIQQPYMDSKIDKVEASANSLSLIQQRVLIKRNEESRNLLPGRSLLPGPTGEFKDRVATTKTAVRRLNNEECIYFDARHPEWRDEIIIFRHGRFSRRQDSSMGRWSVDNGELSLEWDFWDTEKLMGSDDGRTLSSYCDENWNQFTMTAATVPAWWRSQFQVTDYWLQQSSPEQETTSRALAARIANALETMPSSSSSSSSEPKFKVPPMDGGVETLPVAKFGAASGASPRSRTTLSRADAVNFNIYSPRREEGASDNTNQQPRSNATEEPEPHPHLAPSLFSVFKRRSLALKPPMPDESAPIPDESAPAPTDHKRGSMQALHEAETVEGIMTIGDVLAKAKPLWTEKDVDVVTNKLLRIQITSVAKLKQALAGDTINERLRAAGYKKALATETLNELRQSLDLDENGLPRRSGEQTPPPPWNEQSTPELQHFDISDAGNNADSLNGLEDVTSAATDEDKLELRHVIMMARPQWTAANADVTVQKLMNIQVFDLQSLQEALSEGLNDRLQRSTPDLNKQTHGPKARSVRLFTTSFIGALRVAVDEALEQKLTGTLTMEEEKGEDVKDAYSLEIANQVGPGEKIQSLPEDCDGFKVNAAGSSASTSSVQNADQQFMDSPSSEEALQKLPSRSCQAEAETAPQEKLFPWEEDPPAIESRWSAEGRMMLTEPCVGECKCLDPCSTHHGRPETVAEHTRTRSVGPASGVALLKAMASPGVKAADAANKCHVLDEEPIIEAADAAGKYCLLHEEGSPESESSMTKKDPNAPADGRGTILPIAADMMPLTSAPNNGASQLVQASLPVQEATLTTSEAPLLALSDQTPSIQAAHSERQQVEEQKPLPVRSRASFVDTKEDEKIAAFEEAARRAESILLRPVEYEMVCSDPVCIHRKPSVDSPVLGQIGKGSHVSGFPGTGWLRLTRLPSEISKTESMIAACLPKLADKPGDSETCGHIYDDQFQECGWIYIGMQLAARCLNIKVSKRLANSVDLRWPGLPGGYQTIYSVEWRPVGKALPTNIANSVNRGLSAGSQSTVRQPHHCLTGLPAATRMRIRVIARISEREPNGLNAVRVLGPWTEVMTENSSTAFLRGKATSNYEDETTWLCTLCARIGQENRIGECIACKALKMKQVRAFGDSDKDDKVNVEDAFDGSLEHLYVSSDWVSGPQTVIQAGKAADECFLQDEEEPVIEDLYDDVDWTLG